ncbi:MAG TPA: glycosyltransferase family 4 protein [Nitrosomonas halophila]|nr:glycosyltransferase family 4 protein [Nitrosomonas halophila]
MNKFHSSLALGSRVVRGEHLEESERLWQEISGLRIGLVGPLPPPAGGMANQTRQLAGLLQQAGAQVTLLQVNAPYQPAWIGRIKGVRAIFRLLPYLLCLWTSARKVELFHVMSNSGWSWHLFTVPAIWIAHLRHKPVVINYRGGEAEAFFARSFFWIKPSLKHVQAVIVPSAFLKSVFEKYGIKAIIVPNIIDLERFSMPAGTERRLEAPHIIVTRNLEPIYDIATAIYAFARVKTVMPAARLTIAGSGPERSSLECLVTELKMADSVHFTGRLENEAIATLYQQADLMVNPSLVDNMPNSILEALASGVPVVSTNVGGVPFLVTHNRDALLVPPGEPVAMAEAMLAVLGDRTMATRLAEKGLESVRQYTWPRVRNRLLAVYRQVLAGH